MIAAWLSQFWVQRLGWTLLHFLWQGTAIAAVYAMLRSLLQHSRWRYGLACSALAAMVAAPPLTFALIPDARGSGSWTLSAAEWQCLLPTVVALWLLGVLAFSVRLWGGWRFTTRLRSTSHPAPAEWQRTLERLAARVGAPQSARLLVSSLVNVPTVIGWLRPVILIPIEFLTGLPLDHVTALLAHELAHIRRQDYLASVLQGIAEVALFYHPAVWWISEQIRAERELCCDDLAVAATGDVLIYARALAQLESRQPAPPTPALAANGGSLINRVRRLMEPAHAIANSLPGPATAWAMTVLWLAGVVVAAVHGGQTPAATAAILDPVAASAARKILMYDPLLAAHPLAASKRAWRPHRRSNEPKAFLPLNAGEERPQTVRIQDPDPAISAKIMDHRMPTAPVVEATLHGALPATPEEPPPPAFRTATKLVQVDVIARRKGAPATGLTAEDFTVLDNGKPQRLAFFSVSSSQASRSSAAQSDIPLPEGAVSNRLERVGDSLTNATVLLVDQRNTAQVDQAYAIERIVKFLRTRRNKDTKLDRIGIYTFESDGSLHAVQEITDDAERLSRAADKLKPADPSYGNHGATGITARYVEELDTKQMLQAIARHLASVSGRKGLIWVTSGFPLTLPSLDFNPDMEEAARALNDANVALYAVDARGLVGALDGMTAISNAEFGGARLAGPRLQLQLPGAMRKAVDFSSGIDTMSKLAGLTGGLLLYNTNGIEDSIRKALDDAQLTYTLGFYPAQEEQNGVWHKLKVDVSRPGVKMRYREKYFASRSFAQPNDRPSLSELLKVPLDATQLELVTKTLPDESRPGSWQVRASVDLHDVYLENQNNTWVGAVDVSFLMEGSRTVRTITRKVEIPDRQLASALEEGIVVNDSIRADSATRELRIVAQDRVTGAAGSVRVALGNP